MIKKIEKLRAKYDSVTANQVLDDVMEIIKEPIKEADCKDCKGARVIHLYKIVNDHGAIKYVKTLPCSCSL